MGALARWLLDEEQKELFEYLYATVLTVVFLALVALALWPMGRAVLAWRLMKGYWLFWLIICWSALLLLVFQRTFRVNLYDRSGVYIISGLVVSGFLQVGWSAFVALTLQDFLAGAPVWVKVVLYFIGVLSCYVGSVLVGAMYQGHIYRFINFLLALLSFAVFGVWPAAGRAAYGWFFNLF